MSSEPEPLWSTLPRHRRGLIFLAPGLLLLLAWGVPSSIFLSRDRKPNEPSPVETAGESGYARNCAYCHGIHGDGRGSVVLTPPARYFGRDKFKFATTMNGMPTDDDLHRILEHGIPGSAMPSFAHVPKEDRQACIEQVRRFVRQGLYDAQVQNVLKKGGDESDIEPEKFSKVAAQLSAPGAILEIPSVPVATPQSAERGRATYAKICAACHGPEGKGDGPQVKDLKNDDGSPNIPRDLTLGQYKGGGDARSLYARIKLGIPGTPMPASDKLSNDEMFDLIHFLQSLPKQKR